MYLDGHLNQIRHRADKVNVCSRKYRVRTRSRYSSGKSM